MEWFFLILLGTVLVQRLFELRMARRNTLWMKERGGKEFGAGHYPLLVLIHALFFVSLSAEVFIFNRPLAWWWGIPFIVFIAAQGLRWWCIATLGRFWNTRIVVLPHSSIIRRGPYRWLRHPNYVVVMLELLVLPLIFRAYFTAITVSILNYFVLKTFRIPAEERALSAATDYGERMAKTARWWPVTFSRNRS